MRGGDAHGPERLFDVDVAFDDNGIIRSMKMRALENVGAYAGRSPFQLGKPIGAIVGPYKIKSVQYRAIAVVTNKTTQEAVRGFGQAPTNVAIERTMDEVANALGLDPTRNPPAQHDPARGIPLHHPERHHLRQRRLSHRHRQGAGAHQLRGAEEGARPPARRRASSPASASPPAWSRPAATPCSRRCSIRAITTSTFMDSCRINVDGIGIDHRHHAHHLVRPGPRDAGRHRDRRGAAGRSRTRSG